MSSEIMLSRDAMGAAMQVADTLSKSALIPSPLRNKPADVVVILLTGQELGLSPMQSLRGLHVIEGRAVASAEMVAALCLRSPHCEYLRVEESDDRHATVAAKRKGGKEFRLTITMDDAQRAGLAGKQNWRMWPAAMLRARAISHAARATFPDLVLGVYTEDEAGEIVEGALVAEQKAEVRAVVQPPHLREKAPEPAVEGEVVEAKTEPAPVPAPAAAVVTPPPPANGEPSAVDLLALALHEAQTDADVTAAGKRIKAARQSGVITEEQRQDLGKLFTQRQREVRQ